VTDYSETHIPQELVLVLLQAAHARTMTGSIFDAMDTIRLDRETWNTVATSIFIHMKHVYPGIELQDGDAGEMTDTEKALLDTLAIATMFGALIGAEQELKVTAVVSHDDAGRTINTPKARLRHNDPRLRRRRMR
jgi:hypothetical protein